jgi:hypothetical protein
MPKKTEEEKFCCIVSRWLEEFSEAREHLINARREVLLAIKTILDKELERLEKASHKKEPLRKVEVK